MRSYFTFLVTAALLPVSLVAVIVVHGGWDAVTAGLSILVGMGFLTSLIALLAAGERRLA